MTYRSVAASCVTRYWTGVRRFLSSLLSTLIAGDGVFLKLQNFLLILPTDLWSVICCHLVLLTLLLPTLVIPSS